ncbi:unnamed protein product, partial [marine sediment metagenome]
EVGLNPEVPPKSLDEVLEFNKKIYKTDAKGKIVTLGFIPNNLWGSFVAWAYMWGGDFYNEKTGKITAFNPVNEKALQWQIDFFKKYGGIETVSAWQQGFTGGANDPFIKRKLGMMTASHYHYYFWYKYGPPDFLKTTIGYAPIPKFPGPDTLPKGQVLTSNAHIMLKGCKNPEAAYTFLKELCYGEGYLRANMPYAAYTSSSRSLNERFEKEIGIPDFWPKELWKLELHMLETKKPWPSIPVVGRLMNELTQQVE